MESDSDTEVEFRPFTVDELEALYEIEKEPGTPSEASFFTCRDDLSTMTNKDDSVFSTPRSNVVDGMSPKPKRRSRLLEAMDLSVVKSPNRKRRSARLSNENAVEENNPKTGEIEEELTSSLNTQKGKLAAIVRKKLASPGFALRQRHLSSDADNNTVANNKTPLRTSAPALKQTLSAQKLASRLASPAVLSRQQQTTPSKIISLGRPPAIPRKPELTPSSGRKMIAPPGSISGRPKKYCVSSPVAKYINSKEAITVIRNARQTPSKVPLISPSVPEVVDGAQHTSKLPVVTGNLKPRLYQSSHRAPNLNPALGSILMKHKVAKMDLDSTSLMEKSVIEARKVD